MEISATVDERFTAVRDAFAANFKNGLEVGASVAMTVDGKPVVDPWGGDAVRRRTSWQQDTIVNVYSTTKTIAATNPGGRPAKARATTRSHRGFYRVRSSDV